MKLSVSGSGRSRLIEKRSDERDNVKLTNALRDLANGQGTYMASLTTTDATLSAIWTDTVNADSVLNLEIVFVGSTAAAAKRASYVRRQVAYRVGDSNVVLLGGADVIGTDQETDATWGVSITASGGSIVANVQGGAADTVNWRARVNAVWTPYV